MTRDETIKVLALLKAAYPNAYKGMTKEEAMGTISIWTMQFESVPVDIMLMAINRLISTKPFPPAISEVKLELHSLHWDAFSEFHQDCNCLTPEQEAKYRRIYNDTEKYKYSRKLEPSISEIVLGSGQKYIKGETL